MAAAYDNDVQIINKPQCLLSVTDYSRNIPTTPSTDGQIQNPSTSWSNIDRDLIKRDKKALKGNVDLKESKKDMLKNLFDTFACVSDETLDEHAYEVDMFKSNMLKYSTTSKGCSLISTITENFNVNNASSNANSTQNAQQQGFTSSSKARCYNRNQLGKGLIKGQHQARQYDRSTKKGGEGFWRQDLEISEVRMLPGHRVGSSPWYSDI
ncbi:hypothetical protein L1987_16042 [Smallanthus sonchifolius]|uniref:Uncharacterized protein n=1 Tax=Smallanthus sonchifolius TaxID=185202 RepID=A0ACB9J841_9ASTR|nr:hypothetical protein L1987_16042 [Smallanthus sonchifolius]